MRHKSDDAQVGEDSFLDTTANLVGILIILVVVIGTKTKLEAEELGRQQAAKDAEEVLQAPVAEATALDNSLLQQAMQQQEYALETEYRRAERNRLLATVQQAREIVEQRVASLDEEKRETLEHQRKKAQLEQQLSELTDKIGSDSESPRPTVVLEHLPTPMARTVFNREMHIQLKDGRVTVIPWDRLVDTLKAQAPVSASRQASRENLEDQLGPVGGFIMRYRMNRIPGGFELDRFEIETTADAPSEPLQQALSPTGRLRLELASRNPAETVVTVWVYEDSFGHFGTLKSRLFEEGFLCAARPLPHGLRISASPRGSRSAAQ
jgi:hypothetical protein